MAFTAAILISRLIVLALVSKTSEYSRITQHVIYLIWEIAAACGGNASVADKASSGMISGLICYGKTMESFAIFLTMSGFRRPLRTRRRRHQLFDNIV